jgi:hypothetical protein
LKQFPEIINTAKDRQKAAQSIGHCMESTTLENENIDQAYYGIDHQKIEEDLFGARGIDNFPKHKKVKGEFGQRRKIAEQRIENF